MYLITDHLDKWDKIDRFERRKRCFYNNSWRFIPCHVLFIIVSKEIDDNTIKPTIPDRHKHF